jgi:RNA polymerase sigma-70 factor, ECF subfamily
MSMMKDYVSSAISRTGDSSASVEQAEEDAWISASQRGDALSFNRLVLKWEKIVYNIAFRMLQDREDAAEATQEVFLLAFKSIRRFRHNAKFSTWLYRIAINRCVTRARQRPQGLHLSIDGNSTAIASIEQLTVAESQAGELLQFEQRRRVLDALSHLQAEQQAVIELKFFQELTFEEIAEVLDVPLSTIKSRLYSGLEMLKSRLGDRD